MNIADGTQPTVGSAAVFAALNANVSRIQPAQLSLENETVVGGFSLVTKSVPPKTGTKEGGGVLNKCAIINNCEGGNCKKGCGTK